MINTQERQTKELHGPLVDFGTGACSPFEREVIQCAQQVAEDGDAPSETAAIAKMLAFVTADPILNEAAKRNALEGFAVCSLVNDPAFREQAEGNAVEALADSMNAFAGTAQYAGRLEIAKEFYIQARSAAYRERSRKSAELEEFLDCAESGMEKGKPAERELLGGYILRHDILQDAVEARALSPEIAGCAWNGEPREDVDPYPDSPLGAIRFIEDSYGYYYSIAEDDDLALQALAVAGEFLREEAVKRLSTTDRADYLEYEREKEAKSARLAAWWDFRQEALSYMAANDDFGDAAAREALAEKLMDFIKRHPPLLAAVHAGALSPVNLPEPILAQGDDFDPDSLANANDALRVCIDCYEDQLENDPADPWSLAEKLPILVQQQIALGELAIRRLTRQE